MKSWKFLSSLAMFLALACPAAAQLVLPGNVVTPGGVPVAVTPTAIINPNDGVPCIVGNTGCPSIGGGGGGGTLGATVNLAPLTGLPDGSTHNFSLTQFAASRQTLNDPATGLDVSFNDNRQIDTTINSATSNAAYTISLNGGLASTGVALAGLTASGATVTPECSNNIAAVTPQWTTCRTLTGEGALISDGNYRWDVAGRTSLRLRVSTTGTGLITISHSSSSAPVGPPPTLSSGVLRPIIQADSRPFLNMTTNTTTKIVTGVAGKQTYITGYSLRSGGITTGKLVSGTGANCGTGTADLTETFDLAANDGQVIGSGLGEQFHVPAATDICAVNGAAQNLRVSIAMTQQP